VKNSLLIIIAIILLKLFSGCATSSLNWEQAKNRRELDGEVFLSKYYKYPEAGNNKFEYNEGVIFVYPKGDSPENVLCLIVDSKKNIFYRNKVKLEKESIYRYYISHMNLPIGKYTAGVKFKIENKTFLKKFEIVSESIIAKYKRICPKKLAILPAINHSTDVEGAIVFRNLLYLQMEKSKKFELMNMEDVDDLLNEEGITAGGQLNMVETSDLFEILGVDGLLFVEIKKMVFKTYGIGSDKKVNANFKIITPDTTYWNKNWRIDTGTSPLSTILDVALAINNSNDDFLKQLGEKSVKNLAEQITEKAINGWLLEHELLYEMNEIIVAFINGLPQL